MERTFILPFGINQVIYDGRANPLMIVSIEFFRHYIPHLHCINLRTGRKVAFAYKKDKTINVYLNKKDAERAFAEKQKQNEMEVK